MGLFSNKKKGCPVCGEPTPRILPSEVEGMPICKSCAKKVFLPNGKLEQMSLGEFQQYLSYYDDNKVLRDKFKETYYRSFSFFGKSIHIDEPNGLFRFTGLKEDIVFEAKHLIRFCISEDMSPVFEGDAAGLKCYESDVPARARDMAPQLNMIRLQKQHMKMMERLDKDDNNHSRPYIDITEPFKNYHIDLYLDHPYWYEFKEKLQGPVFDNNNPRVDDYLDDYEKTSCEMNELAEKLMKLINPAAPVIRGGAEADTFASAPACAPVQQINVVEELKKYKELFDMGVITEEEFAAKKRQLMGI